MDVRAFDAALTNVVQILRDVESRAPSERARMVGRAVEVCSEAVICAREHGDSRMLVRSLRILGTALAAKGEPHNALRAVNETLHVIQMAKLSLAQAGGKIPRASVVGERWMRAEEQELRAFAAVLERDEQHDSGDGGALAVNVGLAGGAANGSAALSAGGDAASGGGAADGEGTISWPLRPFQALDYSEIVQRMEHAKVTTMSVVAHLRQRARCEDQYSRALASGVMLRLRTVDGAADGDDASTSPARRGSSEGSAPSPIGGGGGGGGGGSDGGGSSASGGGGGGSTSKSKSRSSGAGGSATGLGSGAGAEWRRYSVAKGEVGIGPSANEGLHSVLAQLAKTTELQQTGRRDFAHDLEASMANALESLTATNERIFRELKIMRGGIERKCATARARAAKERALLAQRHGALAAQRRELDEKQALLEEQLTRQARAEEILAEHQSSLQQRLREGGRRSGSSTAGGSGGGDQMEALRNRLVRSRQVVLQQRRLTSNARQLVDDQERRWGAMADATRTRDATFIEARRAWIESAQRLQSKESAVASAVQRLELERIDTTTSLLRLAVDRERELLKSRLATLQKVDDAISTIAPHR